MKPTCALIQCDSTYRITWLTTCPAEMPHDKVLGRRPWEFIRDESQSRELQAAMARVNGSDDAEEVDFTTLSGDSWRAWVYNCPNPASRVVILARKTPKFLLSLTPKERRLCALLAKGRCINQVASTLGRSTKTIYANRRAIAEKLGILPGCLPVWCGEHREWL